MRALEVIQNKKFIVSGGSFHGRVIFGDLYKMMFGILTHKFVILYGGRNIE